MHEQNIKVQYKGNSRLIKMIVYFIISNLRLMSLNAGLRLLRNKQSTVLNIFHV